MSTTEINGEGVRLRAYRPDDAEAVAAGYDEEFFAQLHIRGPVSFAFWRNFSLEEGAPVSICGNPPSGPGKDFQNKGCFSTDGG